MSKKKLAVRFAMFDLFALAALGVVFIVLAVKRLREESIGWRS